MKIQSIAFKKIASYGNQIQKIEFKDEGAELFLTLGKNGDGKTTIANAILFALYGKVEGARMADLPNRINKNLWVRIKLSCKGMDIDIERGLLPNKFSVLVNGVEFDKAGKKSIQEYLEDEIYGIPYHVFKNIIILSINDFKSFLTMTGTDKKKIIDRMFGFSILNEMFNSVKEERKQLKMDLDSLDAELRQILESITSVRGKLNTLVLEADEKNKGKIEEMKASLLDLGEKAKKIKEAKDKSVLVESLNNGRYIVYLSNLSLKRSKEILALIEGKPVHKGDVLYDYRDNKVTIYSMFDPNHFYSEQINE